MAFQGALHHLHLARRIPRGFTKLRTRIESSQNSVISGEIPMRKPAHVAIVQRCHGAAYALEPYEPLPNVFPPPLAGLLLKGLTSEQDL
jgi:hypothetical protein